MEKQVYRERKLDAFILNIEDLYALWAELLRQFSNPDDVRVSFEIELGEEKLKFENIEEIKQYSLLPDRITKYSLYFPQGNRSVHLRSHDFFMGERAEIRATSDEVGWCAGVIEVSVSFLRKYRVWYHWIYYGLAKLIISLTSAIIVADFLSKSLAGFMLGLSLGAVFGIAYFFLSYAPI